MEQISFGFAEDDSTLMLSPRLYHAEKTRDTLQDLMDESTGFLAVESNLIKFGYKWKLYTFPSGTRVVVVNIGKDRYVVDDFKEPWVREINEWLWRLDEASLMEMFPQEAFNDLFWRSGGYGKLYHGTTEENLPGILANGLQVRDQSRGISNRGTGMAVFMSEEYDTAAYYFPVVLEIDVGAMKADGFMPEMERESPVREAELRDAVAHRLGVTDFHQDVESGIDSGTVICRETIPPKYLRRVE
jgi:hypothetical protein